MQNLFSAYRRDFVYVFKISIKTTLNSGDKVSLQLFIRRRRMDALCHFNDVVCPLCRRCFLKKVAPSFEK